MENIKCIDVMENLGYINLIDHNNNIWDPQNLTEFQQPHANDAQLVNGGDLVGEEPRPLDELGFMFLEWLKSNKPNRSTVGSDSKQLGNTTEGKKQLMKLVIEWASCQFPFNYQEPFPNPNISVPMPSPSHSFATNNNSTTNDNNKFSSNDNFPDGQGCDETEDQVPGQNCDGNGTENLVYLSSWVTNVARKKRRARRNRFLSQNCSLHSNSQGHKFNEKQNVNKQCRPGEENRANEDGLQGRKSEKQLRFLLRKVLTQSDVGDSGRIVLPKKEAETHLPKLNSRDGIPIAMEADGKSRVWSFRYKFWLNNKSRMYVLYNTGAFVRLNRLQEGDTLMIYKDIKSNKYLIRGVRRSLHQEACDEPQ